MENGETARLGRMGRTHALSVPGPLSLSSPFLTFTRASRETSVTRTSRRARHSSAAAAEPAMPAPTMTTAAPGGRESASAGAGGGGAVIFWMSACANVGLLRGRRPSCVRACVRCSPAGRRDTKRECGSDPRSLTLSVFCSLSPPSPPTSPLCDLTYRRRTRHTAVRSHS